VDKSMPSLILRSPYDSDLPRAAISVISQLRTDFSALNARRFSLHQTESPRCEACGASSETRAHFLLHCPAWDRYRAPLQIASFAAGILGNVDVPSLLSHPKLLKPLSTFISATKRFCTASSK